MIFFILVGLKIFQTNFHKEVVAKEECTTVGLALKNLMPILLHIFAHNFGSVCLSDFQNSIFAILPEFLHASNFCDQRAECAKCYNTTHTKVIMSEGIA